MAMAEAPRPNPDEPATAATGADEPVAALSWAEQETVDALTRLAKAQANVQALEEQGGGESRPAFDPADEARLADVHADLEKARAKAAGRFGKGAAREKVGELEMAERLVLDRMGVADYDAYLAATAERATGRPTEAVDPQLLAFARQELEAARRAWLEVQAMAVPDAEPDAPSEPGPGAIDLTASDGPAPTLGGPGVA